MLEQLKEKVFQANLELPKQGLIKYTWGNVSQLDESKQYFVIKPSGVSYDKMQASDMVVCDLSGQVVEGNYRPSSDTPTHAYLYQHVKNIGGICHTHSTYAVGFSQAGLDLLPRGTTHADTFYGAVPCARFLTEAEIQAGYEQNTGKVILETFQKRQISFQDIPGVLLQGHGPFTWGKDAFQAVEQATILEEICKMNFITQSLNPNAEILPQRILDKHYQRKHGKDAYYGQK
ncbi:L-ribulose-5-phosphate 4-epimerase [Enterococcus timonensis]|uniref:L-ribulose-5-phosphate 4-epimerase n=1 Tax=Enterococcus timonensis TaxID=1852364 RepID=UPI0008D98239|nr:L-ribulose-5-phosphate 4-epimerase [Enterococcus timonensis]